MKYGTVPNTTSRTPGTIHPFRNGPRLGGRFSRGISNSWLISFGKDSFWSLINILFICVNEHCANYSGNHYSSEEDSRYWFLILKLNQLPEFHSVIYVPSHGTLISQYLQPHRTIFYLLDLEVPELSSTWCIFPLLMKIFENSFYTVVK